MSSDSPLDSLAQPPPFAWEEWYAAVGGRTIRIEEVSDYLQKIYDDQYARFEGPVAPVPHDFASAEDGAEHLKRVAVEFGADIVGIARIEPSDIYRGRTVTEAYAVAVGRWLVTRETLGARSR